jgi:hypothetical protein
MEPATAARSTNAARALTLRRNRRRDGNPAILCETAEAE